MQKNDGILASSMILLILTPFSIEEFLKLMNKSKTDINFIKYPININLIYFKTF